MISVTIALLYCIAFVVSVSIVCGTCYRISQSKRREMSELIAKATANMIEASGSKGLESHGKNDLFSGNFGLGA